MNLLPPVLADFISDLLRTSVLLQLFVLIFGLIVWFFLQLNWHLETRIWPFEHRFKYIALFKPLANEVLLLVILRVFALALQNTSGVAGLALFISGFYGFCVFTRIIIILLRLRVPISIVKNFDLSVLRPFLVIFGLLGFIAQISDLPSLLDSPVVMLGSNDFNFNDLLLLLFGSYFLATGTALPAWCLTWFFSGIFQLSKPAHRAAELIIRYLITGIGFVFIFMIVGVNYTFLAAIGGGLSVGLGFGLKEIFSNFISGIWLLIEGAVRPGDVLLLENGNGEDPCEVLELGMRATTLWRDRDNVELVVPNQLFFTQQMVTYSGVRDRYRRGQVLIGAAYRHPPEQVIAILEAVAATVPRVLAKPAPKGLLLRYDDSAITYAIRYWIEDPMNGISVASEVGIAVWNAFSRERIEIPYPQRVLHMDAAIPNARTQI